MSSEKERPTENNNNTNEEDKHTTNNEVEESKTPSDPQEDNAAENTTDTKIDNEFSLYGYVKKNYKNAFIVVLLLTIIIMYLWAYFALRKTERLHTKAYHTLYDAATSFSNKKDSLYLVSLGQAFSYAILSEKMQRNLRNIELYTAGMLQRDRNMIEIIIADKNGDIMVSTNKKHEQNNLRNYMFFNYLSLNNIVIKSDVYDDSYMVFAPLKGLNRDWGYLIFRYKRQDFVHHELLYE